MRAAGVVLHPMTTPPYMPCDECPETERRYQNVPAEIGVRSELKRDESLTVGCPIVNFKSLMGQTFSIRNGPDEVRTVAQ